MLFVYKCRLIRDRWDEDRSRPKTPLIDYVVAPDLDAANIKYQQIFGQPATTIHQIGRAWGAMGDAA